MNRNQDIEWTLPRRQKSLGQDKKLSLVDCFGIWLSARAIRRWVSDFHGLAIADVGCGYRATFCRSVLEEVQSLTLVDVSLAEDLQRHPKVRAIQGTIPNALRSIGDESLDVVMCISVLEHLWDPLSTVREFCRVLRPNGVCLINVPSWRGKWFLEFSAFRLRTSPAFEMDDHKMYYDKKDLWPLLVRAGFKPSQILCFSHKFGLNTFAICRKSK